MSAAFEGAYTLHQPENTTPNEMPWAPQAPAAQYAATNGAAEPAPQVDRRRGPRGPRQPVVIQSGPYIPVPKAPKAPKAPRQPRGLDLSGIAALEPGAGLYISGVKEGTVRAALRKYLQSNQLSYKPGVIALEDGRIVVGRPQEVQTAQAA